MIQRGILRFCNWVVRRQHNRKLLPVGDPRARQFKLPRQLQTHLLEWAGVFPIAPQTILDVGAHTGEFSVAVADIYQPRFCGMVEPIPELAKHLRQLALPGVSRVFCCALGKQASRASFHVLEHTGSSSLMSVNKVSGELFQCSMREKRTIEVTVRTLDQVFAECGQETLDLLKLDVQGSELDVLAAGESTLARTQMVLTELSFFEHYIGQPLSHEVIEYLHNHGFDLRGTFKYSLDPIGRPLQCDGLFVNTAR